MAAAVIDQPDGATLVAFERQARQQGSGIEALGLEGTWMLQCVWSKGSLRPSPFSNWGLRGLRARLQIDRTTSHSLQITNAVTLGPVELRFRGEGNLAGRRPLLIFGFNSMELTAWGQTLLQRQLPSPAPRRQPFFALIRRDASGWLAARGRGGGLALWALRDQEPQCQG